MNMSSDTESLRLVNRREAIRRVSVMLGGVAFVGGKTLLAACERASFPLQEPTLGEFTAQDIAFLDEIAETILPETKTPGAKAAKIGAFMALMVTDSYRPAEQKVFRVGLRKVDGETKKMHGISFMEATPAQRLDVLTALDREQKRLMDARQAADRRKQNLTLPPLDDKEPAPYFRMMKELALLGYFTSELGCTQALRYIETPGRFDPCIPYTPGEPAWAAHA